MRTRSRCYSILEDEESSTNPSASSTCRKNRKRQRTSEQADLEMAEQANEQADLEKRKRKRKRELRKIWHANSDAFIEELEKCCSSGFIRDRQVWNYLSKVLIQKLKLDLEDDEETYESSHDYAKELRDLNTTSKKIEKSKSFDLKKETRDKLNTIFSRQKLVFKKGTSSRKSSSRSNGASTSSVRKPSWEMKLGSALKDLALSGHLEFEAIRAVEDYLTNLGQTPVNTFLEGGVEFKMSGVSNYLKKKKKKNDSQESIIPDSC